MVIFSPYSMHMNMCNNAEIAACQWQNVEGVVGLTLWKPHAPV